MSSSVVREGKDRLTLEKCAFTTNNPAQIPGDEKEQRRFGDAPQISKLRKVSE